MTALWNIRLQGTLRTLTPICIVPPGADEVARPDGQKFKRVARRSIYQDGLRDTRPVIPGSTLRGRIRRSAVEVVRGLAGGERVRLGEWHQNAVGGIKGAESESGHDVVMRQVIRDKNPILALFGAGSPWMIGRASVSDAVPVGSVETDVVGGVRSDDGRRDGDFFVKLDAEAPDQWRALVAVNAERTRHKKAERQLSAELRAARKGGNADAVARIEADLSELSKKEQELDLLKSNSVSMPFNHEAVPAGVDLLHNVTLRAVRPAEAGLFIAALNHFLKAKPHIGQHEALGYGLIGGEYDVFASSADEVDPFAVASEAEPQALGTMTAEPVVGLTNVPPFLVECMDELKAAFGSGAYDFRVVADVFGRELE